MVANPYVDTSVLVKLYVREPETPQAISLVRGFKTPLPLTLLQELELRNALRLKQARGELTSHAASGAERDLQSDIDLGRFEQTPCDAEVIFRRAETLSKAHAATTMCRTLDILHVATAVAIECRQFASFDRRQRELARKAGLKVQPS